MTDYARIEQTLAATLRLTRPPVAVSFRDAAPAGVAKFTGSQPSGCSFWRLAAQGHAFYTVPHDHYNCPVGSYTHNIPLAPGREGELPQILAMMNGIGYIRMEEVPGIPRLPKTPAVAVYAPLGKAPIAPDVVVIAGTPARLMLLHEAAARARKGIQPLLGRPTCMALPAALGGGIVSSLGCIGNRVYTGIEQDEFYTVIAGRDLEVIAEQAATIAAANATLQSYHEERRAALTTS